MNILIIQTAFIGDVVLTTPLICAAKTAFPKVHVSILVIPSAANVLGNNPYLGETICYDKKGEDRGIFNLLRLARSLKARSFDVAFLPHRSFRSAALALISGIPRRIGFDLSPASFLYTDVIPYRKNAHEVERNLDLIRVLHVEPEPTVPRIFPDEVDYENAEVLLNELHCGMRIADCGIKNPKSERGETENHEKTESYPTPPLSGEGRGGGSVSPSLPSFRDSESRNPKWTVAIAPGSIWPTKRWPLEYFAEVAERTMEIGAKVVLIGGASDRALCDAIAGSTTNTPLIAAGRLTLRESAALLARCDLLLSNDSAPVHIAAAVGTPVVALFGPTTPALGFAPYGPGHTIIEVPLDCRPCGKHGGKRCPKRHFRCMREIAPERVFKKIVGRLDQPQKRY